MNKIFIILIFGIFFGCQKIPKNPKFDTVAKEVEEKTGNKIIWNLELLDDGSVNQESQELLYKNLSMNDVVQIVLLNNRQLKMEYENIGLAYNDLKKITFWNGLEFEGLLRFQSGSLVNIEVSFLQNLMHLMYLPSSRRESFYRLEIEKLKVIKSVLDFTLIAKGLYLKLQVAKQALIVQKENFDAEDCNFLLFKELYKSGNITDLQLQGSKLKWDMSKFKLQNAQHQIEDFYTDLSSLMNLYDGKIKWNILDDDDTAINSNVDLSDLENKVILANYDLKILYKTVQLEGSRLNNKTLKKITGAIELGATAERDRGDWSYGPKIMVLLPTISCKNLSVEEIQFRSAWQAYTSKAIELRNSIRKYKSDWLYTNDEVEFYKNSISPSADIVFSETLKEYNAMLVTPSDLLMSKLAHNNIKLNQMQASLKLKLDTDRLQHLLLGGSDQTFTQTEIIQNHSEENVKKDIH